MSVLSADPFRSYDEPAGSRPDEMERIASDQGQDLASIGGQHGEIRRIHNLGGNDAIAKRSSRCFEGDQVAGENLAKRAEERVAMGGNSDVSR